MEELQRSQVRVCVVCVCGWAGVGLLEIIIRIFMGKWGLGVSRETK